jgi:hypothetical protein
VVVETIAVNTDVSSSPTGDEQSTRSNAESTLFAAHPERQLGFMERRTGVRIERRQGFTLKAQLDVLVPLLIVWLGGIGLLIAVGLSGNSDELVLDPAYYNGGGWWVGIISQLGILGWSVATVSASWAAWIALQHQRTRAVLFLRHAAFVSGWLLIDDLIGVHSLIGNVLVSMVKIPSPIAKAIGLLCVLGPLIRWLLSYANDILRTRWQVLAASLVASFVSISVDLLFDANGSSTRSLFEDGSKFLAVLAWTTYFVTTTYDIARSVIVRDP